MTDAVLIAAIGSFTSVISLVLILLLKKDQEGLKKQIDGQQDLLINAVAGKSFAEGKIEGTDKAAVIAKDLLANPVHAANLGQAAAAGAVPVSIVDQAKPIEVKQTEVVETHNINK